MIGTNKVIISSFSFHTIDTTVVNYISTTHKNVVLINTLYYDKVRERKDQKYLNEMNKNLGLVFDQTLRFSE